MVNTRTRVARVNNVFSISKNAALIQRKMLQYTTVSIKLHHSTLSEIKSPVSTLSDVLACVSKHCVDQKQHSNLESSTKSVNNTANRC